MKKIYRVFLPLLLIICLFAGCECTHTDVLQPEPEYPVARLGPDLTSRVGSYVTLDGSASTAGREKKIEWWEWYQLPDNPMERSVFSGSYASTAVVGFEEPGLYKFTVAVRNESGEQSDPDTVAVEVLQRENTLFEEPALEIHVRFWAKYPEGDLTDSFLMSVDSVYNSMVATSDITSLSGIERCENLRWLGMGFSPLTDLSPLWGLTNLEHLCLTQCRTITDISPLWRLTKLKHLELDENEITDISALMGMLDVEYLRLSHNEISNISALTYFDKLEKIYLSSCEIGNITALGNKPNLKTVFLNSCCLTDLSPLINSTLLEYVVLDKNEITDLSPLTGATNMAVLSAGANKIKDLSPLTNMHKLIRLMLIQNQIENIKPLVDNPGIDSGDSIFLRDNPLDSLSVHVYIPQLRARGVTVSFD